ncbi:MAG: recombination protein NinB [Rhodocyclaceae bacterium]
MTGKRLFILQPAPHPARRNLHAAIDAAPDYSEVLLRDARKSRPQEEKYHAMFGDIARQVKLQGVDLDAESMKRALFSAFKLDTKDMPEFVRAWREFGDMRMIVGFRGEIVMLGDQTRKLPKALASALIEWLYAFGAEHGVEWSDPVQRQERQAA